MRLRTRAFITTFAIALGVAAAPATAQGPPAGQFPEQPSERGQGQACDVLLNTARGQDRVNEVRPEDVSFALFQQYLDSCGGLP